MMARTVQYINQEEIEPVQLRKYMEPLLTSAENYAREHDLPIDQAQLYSGYYKDGSFGLLWQLPDGRFIEMDGVDNDDGTVDVESIDAGVEEADEP